MNNILPFQPEFRPAIPCVRGNVDYSRFEGELVRIDEILLLGGVEDYFVKLSTEHWRANFEEGEEPRAKQILRHQQRSRRGLRCMILLRMLGESFRKMSIALAECQLFQWFCGLGCLDEVRVPGKSELERFCDLLPVESMNLMMDLMIQAASQSDPESGVNGIWLANENLLDSHWQETDWSRAQAAKVLGRSDQILVQLDPAIQEAHARIIGERQVKSQEKILSLYRSRLQGPSQPPCAPVVVRGLKALSFPATRSKGWGRWVRHVLSRAIWPVRIRLRDEVRETKRVWSTLHAVGRRRLCPAH